MTKLKVRPIRIDGDAAILTLTRGYEAVIDVGDIPLVDGYNWQAKVERHTVYAQRNLPRDEYGKREKILLHRLLLCAPDDMQVDHRDGDGLNNMRSNLRLASQSQNSQNAATRCDNISGFKGVTKNGNKWAARIVINGRLTYLGLFETPELAHEEYMRASKKNFGKFSVAYRDAAE